MRARGGLRQARAGLTLWPPRLRRWAPWRAAADQPLQPAPGPALGLRSLAQHEARLRCRPATLAGTCPEPSWGGLGLCTLLYLGDPHLHRAPPQQPCTLHAFLRRLRGGRLERSSCRCCPADWGLGCSHGAGHLPHAALRVHRPQGALRGCLPGRHPRARRAAQLRAPVLSHVRALRLLWRSHRSGPWPVDVLALSPSGCHSLAPRSTWWAGGPSCSCLELRGTAHMVAGPPESQK